MASEREEPPPFAGEAPNFTRSGDQRPGGAKPVLRSPGGGCPAGRVPTRRGPGGGCPAGSVPGGRRPARLVPGGGCPGGLVPGGGCPGGLVPGGGCPGGLVPGSVRRGGIRPARRVEGESAGAVRGDVLVQRRVRVRRRAAYEGRVVELVRALDVELADAERRPGGRRPRGEHEGALHLVRRPVRILREQLRGSSGDERSRERRARHPHVAAGGHALGVLQRHGRGGLNRTDEYAARSSDVRLREAVKRVAEGRPRSREVVAAGRGSA